MAKYVLKRLAIALVTTFIILLLLFLMLEKMPGTPFNDEKLTPEQRAIMEEKYGLDRPVMERFSRYIRLMLKGDFGISYVLQKNMPVATLIKPRIGISIDIGFKALTLGLCVGMFLGIIAALYHRTWLDAFSSVLAVLGISVPSYVFAFILVYFFGYSMQLLPLRYNPSDPGLSSVMPVIALSMFTTANIARFLRSEMLEVLGSEYILLSRAKGLKESHVIVHHGIRNSLIPVITVVGPLMVNLMTGSLVVEKIFAIPGLGSLLIQSIEVNDYNIVIAVSFIYSVMFIGIILVVDILYGIIDPRIRLAKGGQS